MINIRPFISGDTVTLELRDVFLYPNAKELTEDAFEKGHSYAYTLLKGDKIIAVFGLTMIRSDLAEVWSLLSDDIECCSIQFARICKRYLDYHIKQLDVVRAHAVIRSDYDRGFKFLKFLGFEREGTLKKFGLEGADMDMWARV